MVYRKYIFSSISLLLLFLVAACPPAEARQLHWQEFRVTARLANDGRLHIQERQTIVFNGAWNGGERVFNVKKGQSLSFERIFRTGSDGREIDLRKGSLDQVDNWNWHGRNTIRWRSRLPNDPPFRNQPITYTLVYSYANILTEQSADMFLLDHDFAFTDRNGVISRFELDLHVDDGWQQAGFPLNVSDVDLPPGKTIVVRQSVKHLQGGPDLVHELTLVSRISEHPAISAAPGWLSAFGFILLITLLIACSRSMYRHERSLGRLDPLPERDVINERWLQEHVFSMLPETVGATWDKSTSSHEVAAILARFVVEEKMTSRLEPYLLPIVGWKIPGQYILHMSLRVPRSTFKGYERDLVDGLFIEGDSTDTKKIRRYYRKKRSSFLPAQKIQEPLENKVKLLTAALNNPLEYDWFFPLVSVPIAVFMLIFNAFLHMAELGFTIAAAATSIGGLLIGSINGYHCRSRSDHLQKRLLFVHLFPALLCIGFVVFYLFGVSTLLCLSLLLFYGAAIYNPFYIAKTRDSREGVKLCQRLAAARSYFKAELEKPVPAIQDQWFPYLLAFGLGPEVDKWTRQFMLAGTAHHSRVASPTAGGGASSFSGGGGSFGGAGASGSWAAAATSLGSSASSSSSGGGGGSSGGGGGGGW